MNLRSLYSSGLYTWLGYILLQPKSRMIEKGSINLGPNPKLRSVCLTLKSLSKRVYWWLTRLIFPSWHVVSEAASQSKNRLLLQQHQEGPEKDLTLRPIIFISSHTYMMLTIGVFSNVCNVLCEHSLKKSSLHLSSSATLQNWFGNSGGTSALRMHESA